MNDLQLEYFLSVATTKSVTRSANELFVSPPAISKQITLLEREFGIHLFYRDSHGMSLTAAGELMFEHLSWRKTSFELALRNAHALDSEKSHVRLGIISDWDLYRQLMILSETLKTPLQSITLDVSCFDIGKIGSQLEDGVVDAIICMNAELSAFERPDEVVSIPLAKINRTFVYSSLSPLAGKPDLTPADFASKPLFLFPNSRRFLSMNDYSALCSSYGFTPRKIIWDDFFDMLLNVGMDKGFMVADVWAGITYHSRFSNLVLDATNQVNLAWLRQNQNPSLPITIDRCIDIFRSWEDSSVI